MGFFDRFRSRRARADGSPQTVLDAELKNWRIVKVSNAESGYLAIFRIRLSKPPRSDMHAGSPHNWKK